MILKSALAFAVISAVANAADNTVADDSRLRQHGRWALPANQSEHVKVSTVANESSSQKYPQECSIMYNDSSTKAYMHFS